MNAQKRYGLIGWPVDHSASAQMQEAGFRAAGLSASYQLFPVVPENLSNQIQWMKEQGFAGWNVTIPHKKAVLPLLDSIDAEASALQSVNTVVVREGRLHGFSTDGWGLERALWINLKIRFAGNHLVFLGSGGAVRAGAIYAALHGARKITLINRTLSRAVALAGDMERLAPGCCAEALPADDAPRIRLALEQASVLINGTSLGLQMEEPMPLPPAWIPAGLPFYDMIYAETSLQKALRAQGNLAVAGWDMLLYQGCRSFELWTGLPAPEEAMRQELLHIKNARRCSSGFRSGLT